jgi:hypothetical protein
LLYFESLWTSFKERDVAAQMFKGKRGQQLAREIGKRAKTFVPGAGIPEKKPQQPAGPSKEEVDAIKVKVRLFSVDKAFFLLVGLQEFLGKI